MITAIIIALYVVGIFVAYEKIKDWNVNGFEKIAFSIIWPLILILYGIYCINNKL